MDLTTPQIGETVVIERRDLQQVLDALQRRGYHIIGPTVHNGAITYSTVETADEFPIGWTDRQAGGTYRLERRDDEALFGFTVGPQSWKRLLHPPVVTLWSAERTDEGFALSDDAPAPPRYAFFGVRACELNAIEIQDRVFVEGPYVSPAYKARRENAFIVAVNCGKAGNTCFCASTARLPYQQAPTIR